MNIDMGFEGNQMDMIEETDLEKIVNISLDFRLFVGAECVKHNISEDVVHLIAQAVCKRYERKKE